MPGTPREKTVTDTDPGSVSGTDPVAGTGNDADASAASGSAWVAALGSLALERARRECFLAFSGLLHEELVGRAPTVRSGR